MESKTILQCFAKVAPYINDIHVGDFAIAVSDTEKYLAYYPGKEFDHGVKSGDLVKKETVLNQAMEENRRVVKQMGKELFGFPYIAVGIPLKDNNEVIGGVCLLESIKRQDKLIEIANVLSEKIIVLQNISEEVNKDSKELLDTGSDLGKLSSSALENSKKSGEVTKIVKKIAGQSNLLGLNAAIEAARLGKDGQGFKVVADEIRNLANSSKESIESIEEILEEFQATSSEIAAKSNTVDEKSRNQVDIVNKTKESIESLNRIIEELKKEAEDLSDGIEK